MSENTGIGTYIKNIVPHLIAENNWDLVLLVKTKSPWTDPHKQKLFSSPIYSLQEQLKYPFVVPSCDLFWSPHYNVPFFPIRAKKRVVTVHDVCHLVYGNELGWLKKRYAKTMLQKALQADKIVTVSHFSKQEILKYLKVNPEKITVIHNGAPVYTHTSSHQLDIPSPFILYVGNNKPHKNLSSLLQAFHLLRQELHVYHLVLVGKDPSLASLPSPVIHVFSDVSDESLPYYYKQASLLVCPSTYEGFGLPALEAMAYNCPVAASHSASLPEVCGNAASYFDPINPKQIAKVMKELLINQEIRKQHISLGKKQMLQFSWKNSAKKHKEIFLELLES